MGWKIWVLIPGWSKRFFSSQNIQASLRAHPDPYSMGTKIISPGVYQPGCEVDHFHLVPRLRMCGAIPILLLPAFMAWRGTTLTHTHTHTHSHLLVIAIFSFLLLVYKAIGVKAKVTQQ